MMNKKIKSMNQKIKLTYSMILKIQISVKFEETLNERF